MTDQERIYDELCNAIENYPINCVECGEVFVDIFTSWGVERKEEHGDICVICHEGE